MNAAELRSFCTASPGPDSRDCQGTFKFKGSNMLFSKFVCHFSRTLYPLSVPGKQERAELHAVLRTEIMRKGTCLDSFQWLPSVTPFSDLLLKGNLFSYAPLTQDMECFLPFEHCYLLGFVFAQFFYCLKLPCMKIYKHAFRQIKHPCFTWDLSPLRPSSHWLQFPGPGLRRPWHGIKKAMLVSDNRVQSQSRFQDVGQPRPGAVKELRLWPFLNLSL